MVQTGLQEVEELGFLIVRMIEAVILSMIQDLVEHINVACPGLILPLIGHTQLNSLLPQ